ncbi:MAG: UvrB/UvrC motif-containing protein [Methylobacter sp.]
MPQIKRTGKVSFSDASLSVWEDPEIKVQGEWERHFKKDVFSRIVQQLNRLSWSVTMPAIEPNDIKHYGGNVARWSAERHRNCSKGELKGELIVSGRCIEFKMFQNINAPDRPDYEGRFQSNKEFHMPYLMRLEMERTRRRIRDYLCAVFSGYEFDAKHRGIYLNPLAKTAMERIQAEYAESCHFKGDLTQYVIQDYNRKSADGEMLNHGQRVWFFDYNGRASTGIARYNGNSMWWVITGKYDYVNKSSRELFTVMPENIRIKRNENRRRKKLESELSKAIKGMNFERAALLRDIIFPKGELFVVWHKEHGAYHKTGFCGYTNNVIDAGKFTADEVKGWSGDINEVRRLEAA